MKTVVTLILGIPTPGQFGMSTGEALLWGIVGFVVVCIIIYLKDK